MSKRRSLLFVMNAKGKYWSSFKAFQPPPQSFVSIISEKCNDLRYEQNNRFTDFTLSRFNEGKALLLN